MLFVPTCLFPGNTIYRSNYQAILINNHSMCNHNDGEHGCCGKHGGEHGGTMTKEEKVAHLEKTIAKLQKKVEVVKAGTEMGGEED